jgi:spermidine synthase
VSGGDPRWILFDEALQAGLRLGLEIEEELFRLTTDHQDLAIYRTSRFGRVMALDGVIQVCERDEFIYHEMLTHQPILAHGAVARVCIIGGGDGGMLREVLRHAAIRATLVEIDRQVIDLSRTWLPAIASGAFDDPRADIVIADGAAYLRTTDARFDVIIVDSTDPIGPGEALFREAFYADCKRCLTPGGVLVTQGGVPMIQPDECRAMAQRLRRQFADVGAYIAAIPTYGGGHMAFGWASDDAALRRHDTTTIAARHAAAGLATRYYNPPVHVAAFALPTYIAELVGAQP